MDPVRGGLLVLSLLIAAWTPVVGAQGVGEPHLKLVFDTYPSNLRAGGVGETLIAHITYESTVPTPEDVEVRLTLADAPTWLRIELPDPIVLRATPGEASRSTTWMRVFADREAPAFEPGRIIVEASATGALTGRTTMATGETVVQTGYAPRLEATPDPSAIRTESHKTTEVFLRLANLGNGPTRVVFAVTQNPSGLAVQLPAPPVLDTRGSGDASTEVVKLRVSAPESFRSPSTLIVTATPVYAKDGRLQGDPVTIQWMVSGTGSGPATHQVEASGPVQRPTASALPWEGDLLVQTGGAKGSDTAGPGRTAWPVLGTLAGAWVGLVLARRRLGV